MFNIPVFLTTIQKVALLLVMIMIGYLLVKTKVVDRKAASVLSILTTNLFSPAYSITNLPRIFTKENLGSNLRLLGIGVIVIIIVIFAARLLARLLAKKGYERRNLSYIFAFSNTGFFGYPVIQGVFGDMVLSQFMLYCTPINIALNSYGYSLYRKDSKFSFRRTFFTPPVVGIYIGCALGILNVQFPENLSFIPDVTKNLGSCMSPASMLSAGIVLGSFPLKKLVLGVRPYLYSLIRLIGLPLLFGVPLYFLGIGDIPFALCVTALALPVGLNTVVFPEAMGIDSSENAKLCFISFIMSILTLPFVFSILSGLGLA